MSRSTKRQGVPTDINGFTSSSKKYTTSRKRVRKFAGVVRTVSAFTFGIGVSIALPAGIAAVYGEPLVPFLIPSGVLLGISLPVVVLTRNVHNGLSIKGSFLLVLTTWLIACLSGAFPFFLSDVTKNFADAVFESTSGFTTTGSSIFADVEVLPYSILFWRSLTHWLGGMGIVVLAVAVLPLLGVSGYRLMSAEAPGPQVERLTSRIRNTGRYLWLIYVGLTVVEAGMLLLGGMSVFDSVNHSFATVATGGFSTRNGSIGAFSSPYIEGVVTVFMVLSGINFALYFRAISGDFSRIRRDSELNAYALFFLIAVIIAAGNLFFRQTTGNPGSAIRLASFQVATLMTSTGFSTADYTVWPGVVRGILLLMLFVGGCAGSTSGGIKMIHVVVLAKVVAVQFRHLVYPRGVFLLRVNQRSIEEKTIAAIAAFVFLYIGIVLVSTVVLMASGPDMETAFTASLAVIGNIGPGFGAVGPSANFSFFTDFQKIWLAFVMILGRLEIFTVLVVASRPFLRR